MEALKGLKEKKSKSAERNEANNASDMPKGHEGFAEEDKDKCPFYAMKKDGEGNSTGNVDDGTGKPKKKKSKAP